jgi:hypothetical protein
MREARRAESDAERTEPREADDDEAGGEGFELFRHLKTPVRC